MPGQLSQQVVEHSDAAVYLILAITIDIEFQGDVGLFGFSFDNGMPIRHLFLSQFS